MVKHVLGKDESQVRFLLRAPRIFLTKNPADAGFLVKKIQCRAVAPPFFVADFFMMNGEGGHKYIIWNISGTLRAPPFASLTLRVAGHPNGKVMRRSVARSRWGEGGPDKMFYVYLIKSILLFLAFVCIWF